MFSEGIGSGVEWSGGERAGVGVEEREREITITLSQQSHVTYSFDFIVPD